MTSQSKEKKGHGKEKKERKKEQPTEELEVLQDVYI